MVHGNTGLFIELVDGCGPANTLRSGFFDDKFNNFTFKIGSGTTHGLTGTGVDKVKINLASEGIGLGIYSQFYAEMIDIEVNARHSLARHS